MISSYQMTFDGEVLERGFWLYVWKIQGEGRQVFYVGRTGDSSSAHASSPFNRIGQHLDFRKNAKGNSLAKRLQQEGIDPTTSKFSMLAMGPIFPEQVNFEAHKPYRDQMATFEMEIAKFLKSQNQVVLGIHHSGKPVGSEDLSEILGEVQRFCEDPDS